MQPVPEEVSMQIFFSQKKTYVKSSEVLSRLRNAPSNVSLPVLVISLNYGDQNFAIEISYIMKRWSKLYRLQLQTKFSLQCAPLSLQCSIKLKLHRGDERYL